MLYKPQLLSINQGGETDVPIGGPTEISIDHEGVTAEALRDGLGGTALIDKGAFRMNCAFGTEDWTSLITMPTKNPMADMTWYCAESDSNLSSYTKYVLAPAAAGLINFHNYRFSYRQLQWGIAYASGIVYPADVTGAEAFTPSDLLTVTKGQGLPTPAYNASTRFGKRVHTMTHDVLAIENVLSFDMTMSGWLMPEVFSDNFIMRQFADIAGYDITGSVTFKLPTIADEATVENDILAVEAGCKALALTVDGGNCAATPGNKVITLNGCQFLRAGRQTSQQDYTTVSMNFKASWTADTTLYNLVDDWPGTGTADILTVA